MKTRFIFLLILLFLFSTVFVYGYTEKEITEKFDAVQNTINTMKYNGLSTTRVEDSLYVAKGLFEGIKVLNTISDRDYSKVVTKLSELDFIVKQAFSVYDELKLLDTEISASESDLNLSSLQPLYDSILVEFKNERYETALDKIYEYRTRLAEQKNISSRLRTISAQLSKNIISVLSGLWYVFVIVVVIILLSYILFRKRVRHYFLLREMKSLENRKKVLYNLLKNTQKEYFVDSKISETGYNVKIDKFNSLMLDLNRQIAILNEELYKLR